MRRTKIICTMGPATDNEDVLRDLMLNGMDVARLNFSHGSHEEALERINRIKKVRDELNIPVAILLDTKGPEVRIKDFKEGKVELKEGQKFTLCTDDVVGDENKFLSLMQIFRMTLRWEVKFLLTTVLLRWKLSA